MYFCAMGIQETRISTSKGSDTIRSVSVGSIFNCFFFVRRFFAFSDNSIVKRRKFRNIITPKPHKSCIVISRRWKFRFYNSAMRGCMNKTTGMCRSINIDYHAHMPNRFSPISAHEKNQIACSCTVNFSETTCTGMILRCTTST